MNNLIMKGKCKVLVLAVGDSSSRNKEANKLSVDESTELGIKLKNLADQFMKYAIYSALLIFVILNVRMLIEVAAGGDLMRKVVNNFNICIILIVVSIPEGLPLTIQISLAFSVLKMIKQKILVRDLNAPEKMGSIEELCCSKTATLTQNKMKVSYFYCESTEVRNSRKDTLFNCELTNESIKRIKESILFNTDARVEMVGTKYVPVGNGTECGLLQMLQDADIPIHLLINLKYE
jgi:P-type Ca2+ transporter type 2C